MIKIAEHSQNYLEKRERPWELSNDRTSDRVLDCTKYGAKKVYSGPQICSYSVQF